MALDLSLHLVGTPDFIPSLEVAPDQLASVSHFLKHCLVAAEHQDADAPHMASRLHPRQDAEVGEDHFSAQPCVHNGHL